MWKFCVWLAFSGKGQEACGNLELGVTWEMSAQECHSLNYHSQLGGSWFIYILMVGECAQCDWMLALERAPSPTQACSGPLVPRIHLLQGVCEYLKTIKADHYSVGVC